MWPIERMGYDFSHINFSHLQKITWLVLPSYQSAYLRRKELMSLRCLFLSANCKVDWNRQVHCEYLCLMTRILSSGIWRFSQVFMVSFHFRKPWIWIISSLSHYCYNKVNHALIKFWVFFIFVWKWVFLTQAHDYAN